MTRMSNTGFTFLSGLSRGSDRLFGRILQTTRPTATPVCFRFRLNDQLQQALKVGSDFPDFFNKTTRRNFSTHHQSSNMSFIRRTYDCVSILGARKMTGLDKVCFPRGLSGTAVMRTTGTSRDMTLTCSGRHCPLVCVSHTRMAGITSSLKSRLKCGEGQLSLILWQPVRHKSGGKKSRSNDDEDSEEEDLGDDDYEAPTTFKKMQIYLKSLRADSVISSALDISRNRVDEVFFGSRLRLNGEKLLKKSKQMSEGDYVDLIMERGSDDNTIMVKRVKIMTVLPDRTHKDKLAVKIKVWKSPFPIEDASKSEW